MELLKNSGKTKAGFSSKPYNCLFRRVGFSEVPLKSDGRTQINVLARFLLIDLPEMG